MVFQGKSLRATESTDETIGSLQTTVGIIAENDNFTNSNTRWDISIRQNISETLSLFMNINNFTNAPDRAFRGSEKYPTQNEVFGWTSDIGLRWNM
jgi:hypothetical protein